MARFIDAEKLTKEIENTYLDGDSSYSFHATGEGDTLIGKFQVLDIIFDQPTADVEEVRHGKWIVHKIGGKVWKRQCSVCKAYYRGISPFCKECGAKMDGGKE